MATTTLLNAVSVNTVGSGSQITGDFEAIVPNGVNLAGGEIVLQVADTDTSADYATIATFVGAGAKSIRNNGSKFFRGVYKGRQASLGTASATLKLVQ